MAVLREYPVSEIMNLHIFGRQGRQKQPLPLFFNGSGIEMTVTGSELWIELEADCDHLEPWVAYEINGALMSRQMILPGIQSICVFRSLDPAEAKTVRFYRELQAVSEDERCRLLIRSVKTDGEFLPPPKYERRLEFIGDSITSGEGTYGCDMDTVWVAMYMSASVNFATMTANALHADYRMISQGGWGVYCGWDNDVRHNLPSVYEKVCGLADGPENAAIGAADPYEFSDAVDAVIVNLGTNDNSAFNTPAFTDPVTGIAHRQKRDPEGHFVKEDIRKVEEAVIGFLKMIRKHNPGAHIVWTYGMLGYEMTLPLSRAVSEYSSITGDKNVAFLNLPNTTPGTHGAHMHPGPKAHEKAAEVLTDYLRQVLEM
ncbi:MAG: SGNH/GDSL hydrolase family protein [Lachnospiraceae bacterium]|nr:SGNH/GDSL hydrolase family protein [Lachnospiraceae bacterium]